jgi:hypothetical protein
MRNAKVFYESYLFFSFLSFLKNGRTSVPLPISTSKGPASTPFLVARAGASPPSFLLCQNTSNAPTNKPHNYTHTHTLTNTRTHTHIHSHNNHARFISFCFLSKRFFFLIFF